MEISNNAEQIIRDILEIEAAMFLEAASPTDPDCAQRMDDMRLHRSSQFAGWSNETLRSYLEDLRQAVAEGRNLMTLKYARMSDSIARLSHDPRIPEILETCVIWQASFISEYPNVMRGGRNLDDFRNYLRGELETYSSGTLRLLKADVDDYLSRGKSMTVDIYKRMARLAGYESLDVMERVFKPE